MTNEIAIVDNIAAVGEGSVLQVSLDLINILPSSRYDLFEEEGLSKCLILFYGKLF